jgi:CheY-like chemotaxis protein
MILPSMRDPRANLVRCVLLLGGAQPDRRPLQLASAAHEVLARLRATLPAGLELREDLDPRTWALADPSTVRQLLSRIVSGACRALPDGGGRLEVGLVSVLLGPDAAERPEGLPEGRWTRLTVRNSGTLLPAAIVRGVISIGCGAITFASEPGADTTFALWLPHCEPPSRAAAVAPFAPEAGTGERILLVDDEEKVRVTCARLLASLGYRLTAVASAEAALAELEADPGRFDLVLTDETMPALSGLQLAARLHALRSDLPVVLMTGYSEALQGRGARAAGVDVLWKPYTFDELAQAVRLALAQRAKPAR